MVIIQSTYVCANRICIEKKFNSVGGGQWIGKQLTASGRE